MKRTFGFEVWLLILAPFDELAAQAPNSQEQSPQVKLPALLKVQLLKEDPKDDELRKLLRARFNEAVREARHLCEKYQAGAGKLEMLVEVGQRIVQSGVEFHDNPIDRLTLRKQYVELTQEAEKEAQSLFDAAVLSPAEFHRVRFRRIDAEIRLLLAKREAEKTSGK